MEAINYEELLPEQPAEDVVSFARENGAFDGQYLIYRSERAYEPLEDRTKDTALVICTACGESFYADKIKAVGCIQSYAPAPFGWWNESEKVSVISGRSTVCPCCGQKAKTVHVGNMRLYGGELVDSAWVSVLTRIPAEGKKDRLALLEWCIRRCIDKQGKIRYEIWPYTAWVVEERKIVRLMGYQKNIGGNISLFGRWKQRKTFCDVYGGKRLIMPWNNRLLMGTTAENSKLDLYLKLKDAYPVSYLALWRKRPAVENLLVQGCGKLVNEWIRREHESCMYGGRIPKLEQVNWKEKRPAQMLGLTKEEFRQMRRGKWNADMLAVYKRVRDAGIQVRLPEDMELLKVVPSYAYLQLLAEPARADFWRILRYLKKQKADWSTLQDYWRMAREDGRDLEDNLVRWPRNLKASHDRQIEERRIIRERKEAAKLAERMAARAPLFQARAEELDRLSFTLDGLLIRPCASEKELIAEGHFLHHCVAGYAQRHAEGKTAILFIRRTDKPENPFFTLEFDEKELTVRQNRGLYNCARTPEVEAFEAAWLAWVKTMMKKARIRAA